jgi:ABC-2 type transport system ATP-binding protein
MCGRVLILDRGRIAASDTPQALVGLMQGDEHICADVQAAPEAIMTALKELEGVHQPVCTPDGDWCRIEFNGNRGKNVREQLFDLVCQRGWRLRELSSRQQHLEDVFAVLTEGSGITKAPLPPEDAIPSPEFDKEESDA